MRKHYKSCPVRLQRGDPVPDSVPPGRVSTSCDGCAIARKACDCGQPCSTCTAKQQLCTYKRSRPSIGPGVSQDDAVNIPRADDSILRNNDLEDCTLYPDPAYPDMLEPDWWRWDDDAEPSALFMDRQAILGRERMLQSATPWVLQNTGTKFDFLLNFTTSSGLKSAFNYSRRPFIPSTSHLAETFHPSNRPDTAVPGQVWEDSDRDSQTTPSVSSLKDIPVGDNVDFCVENMIDWLDDPLFNRTRETWNELRRQYPPHLGSPNSKDESRRNKECLGFFSPCNLRRFVALYWDRWSPHCPMLHRPTFDILEVPNILLVPICLMGAFMSTNEADVEEARNWLDIAERYVFSDALLCLGPADIQQQTYQVPPLKIVQAGYIMCLVQNWEGDDLAKRRIRQQRLAMVVAVSIDVFSLSLILLIRWRLLETWVCPLRTILRQFASLKSFHGLNGSTIKKPSGECCSSDTRQKLTRSFLENFYIHLSSRHCIHDLQQCAAKNGSL